MAIRPLDTRTAPIGTCICGATGVHNYEVSKPTNSPAMSRVSYGVCSLKCAIVLEQRMSDRYGRG